jgi:hypothetical protein
MKIALRPFNTPNFAIMATPPGNRGEGFKEAPSFPLSEVDPETLAAMCDDFRRAVFAKAGHSDPAAPARSPQPPSGGREGMTT